MTVPNWALASPARLSKAGLQAILDQIAAGGIAVSVKVRAGSVDEMRRFIEKCQRDMRETSFNLARAEQPRPGFRGITAKECNEFLATLPPEPLWGEG